jgi:hypothetical protein
MGGGAAREPAALTRVCRAPKTGAGARLRQTAPTRGRRRVSAGRRRSGSCRMPCRLRASISVTSTRSAPLTASSGRSPGAGDDHSVENALVLALDAVPIPTAALRPRRMDLHRCDELGSHIVEVGTRCPLMVPSRRPRIVSWCRAIASRPSRGVLAASATALARRRGRYACQGFASRSTRKLIAPSSRSPVSPNVGRPVGHRHRSVSVTLS